ncbi:MAG: amino acid ABC transporter substrate-binding protein [Deltaproteobacteria bacterium]|nr:MAG: amino acid ABC transporter substrate-binding protein [Deltaproteobacteria bacterium]
MRILLLRPESDDPSPIDQSLGARLWAQTRVNNEEIVVTEEIFQRDDADLERKLARWRDDKVSAVIGATNVPESTRLGELAAKMNLLCFVANNNPVVWQGRRQVFHIGLPTRQTTAAVAALIEKNNLRRVLLLHDQTEFQSRVASSMEGALKTRGMDARSQPVLFEEGIQFPRGWKPDLIYVIFSSEQKALRVAQMIRNIALDIPLLFGRSLLRESFLVSLGDHTGECWFVDMFHRNGHQTPAQQKFFQAMTANGVQIPTANHAFGWDGMAHCAAALNFAGSDPLRAIDYLESRVTLEGASGACCFSRENHNGRFEPGPHTITRWRNHHLEDV